MFDLNVIHDFCCYLECISEPLICQCLCLFVICCIDCLWLFLKPFFRVCVFGSENPNDRRYTPVSQNSCNPGSVMANLRRKSAPVSRFSPLDSSSASNSKNVSALSSNKRRSSVVSQKLNHKNWDVQVALSNATSVVMADQVDLHERDENESPLEISKMEKNKFLKPEMKRALLHKNPDDRIKKHGGSKAGSRVVPYHEESQDSVPDSNVSKDLFKNEKESEELSLIRNQLHQIEKQQSNLLDLLQVCC